MVLLLQKWTSKVLLLRRRPLLVLWLLEAQLLPWCIFLMLLFMNKYEIVYVSLQSSIVHVVKYSEKLNNYRE